MSNYDNLDYRLNILYDFVYNEHNNICYKFKPVSIWTACDPVAEF